jgi:very-short-patch-repair endonuclease
MVKTTQQFIEEAIAVHGDVYDYSKVDYKNCEIKVIIFCKKCNQDFLQTPHSHLKGKRCFMCYSNIKMNKETFTEKAREIHGFDKYNYDNVVYVNNKTDIIVNCIEHGEFITTPMTHLAGRGCRICFHKRITKTKEKFIEEAINKHGDKYDYSKVNYVNDMTKVIFICKIHGEFEQIPRNHLTNGGCKRCGIIAITGTKENFVNKSLDVHSKSFVDKSISLNSNKYDYSLVEYKNRQTNVKIICKIHGVFMQAPSNHLNGAGCLKCSYIDRTKTKEYFIEKSIKIHGDKYDYSKVEYVNMDTRVIIICKIHNEFLQKPDSHMNNGPGCPNCLKKTEYKLYENIKIHYPNIKREFTPKWFNENKYRFDFCIPEHKIIIELDGNQRFTQVRNWKTPEEIRKIDIYKQNKAIENGYSVIRILQLDVFNNRNNWLNTLLKKIKETIEKTQKKVIYICSNNEYQIFIEEDNKLVV